MVSVRPNTIAQSISDQYVIVLYPLTERAMIKWYLAVMRLHWVLHEIHFTTTQICPGFYIYTLERDTSHGIIGLCSHSGLCRLRWIHWVLHDIHVITTEIRPGFYIYTLERSFCLMINIMIDIRHISRCVIQISSQSGLYYMRLRQTISLAPYMSRIYHQLPQEDAWARCRLERLPLNIHATVMTTYKVTPFRVAQNAALTLL